MLKISLIFSLFYLASFLIYLSATSLVAFFHFLLDHDYSTLQAWLYGKKLIIISLSKLSCYFLMTSWLKINNAYRFNFLSELSFNYSLLAPLFLFSFLVISSSFFFGVQLNKTDLIFWGDFVLIYLFTILYFLLDFHLWKHLLQSQLQKNLTSLVFFSLLLVALNSFFVYQWVGKTLILYFFYFHLLLSTYRDRALLSGYLLIIISSLVFTILYPMNLFYGRDNCLLVLIPAAYHFILGVLLTIISGLFVYQVKRVRIWRAI